jgi:hypothetical protein
VVGLLTIENSIMAGFTRDGIIILCMCLSVPVPVVDKPVVNAPPPHRPIPPLARLLHYRYQRSFIFLPPEETLHPRPFF